jgi:hypothetical protein
VGDGAKEEKGQRMATGRSVVVGKLSSPLAWLSPQLGTSAHAVHQRRDEREKTTIVEPFHAKHLQSTCNTARERGWEGKHVTSDPHPQRLGQHPLRMGVSETKAQRKKDARCWADARAILVPVLAASVRAATVSRV